MVFTDTVVATDSDKSHHYRGDTKVPKSPKRIPTTTNIPTKLKGNDDHPFAMDDDIDDDHSRRSIRSTPSIESGHDDLFPQRPKSKANGGGAQGVDRKSPRQANSRRCFNYDIEELLNDDSNRPMFGADRSVCSAGSKRTKSSNRTVGGSTHSRISVDFDVEEWVNNEKIRTTLIMDRSVCSGGGGSHQNENSSASSPRRKKQLEPSSCHRRSVDFDLEDWMNENGIPVLHSEEPPQSEPTDNTSEPLSNHSEPLSNHSEPLSNNSESIYLNRMPLDNNSEPLREGAAFDVETLSLRSSSSHSSSRSGQTSSTWPRLGAGGNGNKKIQLQIIAALRQAVTKADKPEETKLDVHELWSENDLLLVDNFNKDEEEDIRYWKDRLEREEIYLHQYQPTQRERQEVQHVAHFLGIQDLVRTSAAAKNLWIASLQRVADHAILARLHVHTKKLRQVSNEARRLGVLFHPAAGQPVSIVLKRGPVTFLKEKRELIFLTHGFVVAKLPFLESVNSAYEVPVTEPPASQMSPQAAFIPKMLSKISQKESYPHRQDEATARNHDVCRFWTNVRTMQAVEGDPLSFSIVLNNDDSNNFANDEVQYTFTCQSELQAEAWLLALNHVIVRAYTNSATASMAAYFACCDEDVCGDDEHALEQGEEANSSMNSIELEEDEVVEPPPCASPSLNKSNPFQKAMTALQHGGLRFQTFLATRDSPAVVKQRESVADPSPLKTSATEGVPVLSSQKSSDALGDSNGSRKEVDEAEKCEAEFVPLQDAASKAKNVFQNALTALQDRSKRNLMSGSEQKDQKKLVQKLRDKATKQRFLHP